MIRAIILSGGVGSRLRESDIPKQYIIVGNKPILLYSLETIENNGLIDEVYIVAAPEWQNFINEWIDKCNITKFRGFALPGTTREGSVYSALEKLRDIADAMDVLLIHDAARPLVPQEIYTNVITELEGFDGVLPAMPAENAMYISNNRMSISGVLNRDSLFAGQSPESCYFGKLLELHDIGKYSKELYNCFGCSELLFKNNCKVKIIEGNSRSFKITTNKDLERLRRILE